jgi:hypothetical protein
MSTHRKARIVPFKLQGDGLARIAGERHWPSLFSCIDELNHILIAIISRIIYYIIVHTADTVID